MWTKRCSTRINAMADIININAKRALRVIFCNEGPICFMATCMMEYCTVLIPSNIVALTADRGLSVISAVSEKTGVPVPKIGAPPVWGFVGCNEYVDESSIIFKAHILKPYKRALRAPNISTLPLGTVIPELRMMSYLLPNQHDEIIQLVTERKKNIEHYLNRKPFLSRLRALKSLLELWCEPNPSDQVISLGVCSNGSYGIRPGIVFSQPCIQDQKQRWKPFENFSFVNDAIALKIQECVEDAELLLKNIGFDMSSYCPLSDASQLTLQLDK
ncbi:hypothetical protein HUJ04_000407 [Dendroctonus ponderosae]|nr:hypothetical protein HUJ04_000407 [Dendroctonus ponderosae]